MSSADSVLSKEIMGVKLSNILMTVGVIVVAFWILSKECDKNMITDSDDKEGFYWRSRRFYSPYIYGNPYYSSFYDYNPWWRTSLFPWY